ncbi:MAG TPA: hypothetical protein VGZ47_20860 [Gemmataceae bacterium]|jgi:hypothetical protein|nr:hypothetical protein [Gemmataceae bacterium]
MALRNYVIRCYSRGCPREAVYKVASRWSDGITSELKTYSLCCAECLPARFLASLQKQAACRTAPGEILEPPGIYLLSHGQRDQQLQRLAAMEEKLRNLEG